MKYFYGKNSFFFDLIKKFVNHINTNTHTRSLSLSLSLSHTHTHVCVYLLVPSHTVHFYMDFTC